MTQKEFEERIKKIKKQEQKYGVKIEIINMIDKDHLDCIWYGGEVGRIIYKDYSIVISAAGEIRLSGKINGEEVRFVDKNNYGRLYEDLAIDYNIDDEKFYALLDGYPDSFKGDENNYLEFGNNNWFEFDLISPEGEWIDLCDADNVLENNLLDCFEGIEWYLEYVEEEIKERK